MSGHFEGGSLKTAAKLVILEETLDIYTTIITANWESDIWYVDTHAGSGRTQIKDGIVIDGAALRALNNHAEDFDAFYLYEKSEDHFHLLHETLSDRFGYDFDVSETYVDDEDFLVARHNDPYIRIMNMDSNEGVQTLADISNPENHWFTFIDPAGLTAKRETLDTLIERGNMDILLNYQTTGVMRSAAADHSQDAVRRTLGDDDWPNAGTRDEYVALYKEKLEENEEIKPIITKEMVSPFDKRNRFDLVFACQKEEVTDVIEEAVFEQDGLWDKANDEIGQSGLSDWT